MTNNSQDRKSLALDRTAHGWLTEAADDVGLSVKAALEDAILCWSHVTEEMDCEPAELIKSAVDLRSARDRLNEISRAARSSSDRRSELQQAVGPVPKLSVGRQAEVADEENGNSSADLYSTDWDRTQHTAAKVGPGAYRVVNRLSDETGRSAKYCVEEAVQLWCILQYERRGERARYAAERARHVLDDI